MDLNKRRTGKDVTKPRALGLLGHSVVWRRVTDEGPLPEMRLWSILLIKSALKWCIHLTRSFFLYQTKFCYSIFIVLSDIGPFVFGRTNSMCEFKTTS